MNPITCPKCGHRLTKGAAVCPDCGCAAMNGVSPTLPTRNSAIPPEVADWIIHQPSPEVLEWARQTCNEEEFTAALREFEQNGGLELKDFIHELEEGATARA